MAKRGWHSRAATESPTCRRQLARDLLAHRGLPSHAPSGTLGHVVEFLKGGKHQCGILLRKGSRGDRVLDVEGKEDYVDHAKIMDLSSAFVGLYLPRHEMVDALREIDRRRERLKATIDPFELWEVVEPEGDEWTLDGLTDLYFAGNPGQHGGAALFRALEDGHAFRRHGTTFLPLRPELVAQHREEERRAVEAEARLHEAAAWLRRVAEGEQASPPPEADRAVELLAAKVLFGSEHPHAQQASALAQLAHFHSRGAIFNALVQMGHWSKDENLDLLRQEVPVAFAAEVAAEAEGACWLQPNRRRPRLWLRKVYSFTGGRGYHTRAISIRLGLWSSTVSVHFASPALLLRPGGPVHRAAADRAASLHLPDRLIPMLPEAVAERAALTEDELRPSLTVHMRFDSRFQLNGHRIEVCRVRVTHPHSTQEVGAQVERDRGLRKLYGLATHLRQERAAAGAVILPEPEVDVRVREGEIRLHRAEPDEPARLIDQELAILANTLAARLCKLRGLPAIYRAEQPCLEVLVGPGRYDPVACRRQKRLMPKAVLQTRPAAHHGLGVDAYAPISRPFARYTDLLMHQQIIGLLEGGPVPHSEDDLKQALLYTASARASAREIEAASRRYWLLRYLEERAGGELEGVVLEPLRGGCLIELCETRLTAFCRVRPATPPAPGTRVRVRLTRAAARANVLWVQFVGAA